MSREQELLERLERLESIIVERGGGASEDEYQRERAQHVGLTAAKDRLQTEKAWRSWCRYMLSFTCFRKRYSRHA